MDVRIVPAAALALLLAGCSGTVEQHHPDRAVQQAPLPDATEAPVTAAPTATPRPTPTAAQHRYPTRCSTAQLRLAWDAMLAEATGQETLELTLTNAGRSPCHLFGYPGVSLVDAHGAVLPLDYRRGGDQMITSGAPVWVDLAPGETAYIGTNQDRCEGVTLSTAVEVRVIPPDDTEALRLALGSPGDGRPAMSWCGRGDPGSTLSISPVEPSKRATLADH